MKTERIILNFDNYPEYHTNIEKMQNEGKIPALMQSIKGEYEKCGVNKPYKKTREHIESKKFEIIAKVDGGEQKIMSGDWKDFHHSLVDEVTSKFFYNISLGMNITPEAFDFIRRIPIDEWKNIAELIQSSPKLTEEQIFAFKEGQYDHLVFQEKEWPALALKAYFEGKIERNEVSALMLYDALKINYPDSFIIKPVFEQIRTINDENFEKLFGLYPDYTQSTISEKNFNMLFGSQTKNERNKLMKTFNEKANKNAYIFALKEGVKLIFNNEIVSPPDLVDLILKTSFEDKAIKTNAVLGYSIRDDFTHKTYRDVFIFCRYVTTPTINDNENEPINIYLHDLNRCRIESKIPDRAIWLELASVLEQYHLEKALNTILYRAIIVGTFVNNIENILMNIDYEHYLLTSESEKDNVFTTSTSHYFDNEEDAIKFIETLIEFILEKPQYKKEFLKSMIDMFPPSDAFVHLTSDVFWKGRIDNEEFKKELFNLFKDDDETISNLNNIFNIDKQI